MNPYRLASTVFRLSVSLMLMISLLHPAAASANAAFSKWIRDFYQVAAQAGIDKSTYDAVFAGVDTPDPAVIKAARYQPEFIAPVWDYLDSRITEGSIRKGQSLAGEYGKWLDLIESRFGVDRHILLAIWSIESAYGAALERQSVLRGVARSLATLAYADPKRSKFARTQLIAALQIVQNGDVTADGLRGSWAGAMGHTQFIPTSYQTWAVDIDGDGRRNVWTSPQDALASAANLLRKNGWQTGKTWGYEAKLPRGFDYSFIGREGITLRQWSAMGVRRASGSAFPRPADQAVLILPGGAEGPAFLMIRNFYVLKRYNNADKYALAVGHLADRMKGFGELLQTWPRGYDPLKEAERKEVQIKLTESGLYTGEIDGRIGPESRTAIRSYQQKIGMVPDGFASKSLLEKMRAN